MTKLISFDIDGTLEVGDPPGVITMEMVRRAQRLGHLIGSCSDRTLSSQRQIWEAHRIQVDFMVLKHQLASVKARSPAARATPCSPIRKQYRAISEETRPR